MEAVVLHRWIASALIILELSLAPGTARAQNGPGSEAWFRRAVTVSDDSVDRLRLNSLVSRDTTSRLLLRSPSLLMRGGTQGPQMSFIAPTVWIQNNSTLPYGENDGALWAGKGPNARAVGGFAFWLKNFRVVILPEVVYSSNEFFEYAKFGAPPLPADRNPYAAPWNVYPLSIDAPPRFGPNHVKRVTTGQSSASVSLGDYEFGVTTENEWWGPGIRTAIALSDNAEGFPRAFIRPLTLRPTRLGSFDFRITWGGLQESEYFDTDASNDQRYWSGAAITWIPRFERDITLGVARAVYGSAATWGEVAVKPLNFLERTRPHYDSVGGIDGRSEQILSIFGRWAFPGAGLEAYGEWARSEFPASLRDVLLEPGHSQGYTFGVQWLSRPTRAGRVRVQGEHSYLERGPSFRNRPVSSFYEGPSVPQGYTSRGQVIGSALGQGSSGEWLAVDLIKPSYSVGAYAYRTRFNNDAYFYLGLPYSRGNCQHDVTVAPGVRASANLPFGAVSFLYSSAERFNPYFQNISECQSFEGVVTERNKTLKLSVTLGR